MDKFNNLGVRPNVEQKNTTGFCVEDVHVEVKKQDSTIEVMQVLEAWRYFLQTKNKSFQNSCVKVPEYFIYQKRLESAIHGFPTVALVQKEIRDSVKEANSNWVNIVSCPSCHTLAIFKLG